MVKEINEICIVSVARIILRETGEMIDISDSVVGIAVKNNYLKNKMPLVTISIKTTEEIRDIIRDNDINVFIQCNICDNEGETNEVDSSYVYEKGILFSETIRIYEKPYVFVNRVADEDNPSTGDISTAVNDVIVKMSGVVEDTIALNNSIFNEVYYNTSTLSAAFNILSRVGIKDIDIDNGYSTEIHQNILIPPITPLLAIVYLQEYYNIYGHRINSYIDMGNKCYLFDPCQINDYDNIIQLTVTKKNTENMSSTIRPTENTDNQNIYIVDINDPDYVTGGKVTEHQLGSKSIFVGYDSAYNIISREYTNDEAFEKTKIFWNPDNRIVSEKSHYIDLERTDGFSYILTNINPYRINPRTLFRVITDSELIKGDYSITEMDYTLEPQSDSKSRYLSCMVYLTLSKIKEND